MSLYLGHSIQKWNKSSIAPPMHNWHNLWATGRSGLANTDKILVPQIRRMTVQQDFFKNESHLVRVHQHDVCMVTWIDLNTLSLEYIVSWKRQHLWSCSSSLALTFFFYTSLLGITPDCSHSKTQRNRLKRIQDSRARARGDDDLYTPLHSI